MTKQQVTLNVQNIPDELKQLPHWVLWGKGYKDDKLDKTPYQVSGYKALPDNPRTWSQFETVASETANYNGIGIMLKSGLGGIDLDDCINANGEIAREAWSIINHVNSYTEISPSGTGVKIFLWGNPPSGSQFYHTWTFSNGEKVVPQPNGDQKKQIEIYGEVSNRYFTVTGNHLSGTPYTIEARQDALNEIYNYAKAEHEIHDPKPQPKEPRQKRECDDNDNDVIGAFNDAHSVEEILERNGYTPNKNHTRWARPGRGADATSVMINEDGRSYHFSVNDELHSKFTNDAFEAYKVLEHNGNESAAVKAAARELGIKYKATVSFRTGQNKTSEDTEQDTAQVELSGKKLTTYDYIQLYNLWGYDVRLNQCNDDVEVNKKPLDDILSDVIKAQVRDFAIQNDVSINVNHAQEALTTMAEQNSYHPIIDDYLKHLLWDGKDHISFLCKYFQEQSDQVGLFEKWFHHWLVGCVAKVLDGFQNPMLVLDGAQDMGKSYFAKWLCPVAGYYNASVICPDNKDHRLRLINTFIWEVEELGATTRKADLDALKAFLTTGEIRERKPYGRREIIKPAMASFIGTINCDSGFLVDRTGNRRFLTVTLDKIDWQYSQTIDVNQLWAQAMHIHHTGEQWQLSEADKAERDKHNDSYMVVDPIEEILLSRVEFTKDEKDVVATSQLLELLRDKTNVPQRAQSMAIASVLKKMGVTKCEVTHDKKRARGYRGVRIVEDLVQNWKAEGNPPQPHNHTT